jgi:O-antigen/teichoic acid export membrane protein
MEPRSELRRLASSTGLYAAAGLAQQAVGFLLIPVYTRRIDPGDYGVLEIFNTAMAIGFACLTMGLSSAINKVYHRDCETAEERARVLATALLLDAPILVTAALLVVGFSASISTALTGTAQHSSLVPLLAGNGLAYSLAVLVLASLRAQERARAFAILSLLQFVTALALNIIFVVGLGMGVRGVLWGNLLSNALQLIVALQVSRSSSVPSFAPRLMRPLLSFGLYLVPVMLAGWVMDMSDRYLLRVFTDLDTVAVYGVGYKFGMILQVAIVWPFQLAWPAFAFAASKQSGHEATFARTLTYLLALLTLAVLALALLSPAGLPLLVGRQYGGAAAVIPVIALAYACNGIQYAVAPSVHIGGATRWLSLIAAACAVLNVGLNLLLIPRSGMLGAAWATVLAFATLAISTMALAQRVHPVAYEWRRIAHLLALALVVLITGNLWQPAAWTAALPWALGCSAGLFPALLFATGWVQPQEREALRRLWTRRG